MPKRIETIAYASNVCNEKFHTEAAALDCEKRPVTQDKGVKIDDEIIITRGDGAGKRGKVVKIFPYSKSWGHHAWERYWHTIGLVADVIGSYGSRQLTFDDYVVIDAAMED